MRVGVLSALAAGTILTACGRSNPAELFELGDDVINSYSVREYCWRGCFRRNRKVVGSSSSCNLPTTNSNLRRSLRIRRSQHSP
jgi:hypothetical protein